MRALDESIVTRDEPPSDAMILATLLLPPLRDALSPDSVPVQNMAKVVADPCSPSSNASRPRAATPSCVGRSCSPCATCCRRNKPGRRHSRLGNRPFYKDALWLAHLVARAEGSDLPADLSTATESPAEAVAEAAVFEEELPPELLIDVDAETGRDRRGRRGRDGRDGRGTAPEPVVHANGATPNRQPLQPLQERPAPWQAGPRVRTPIPNLADLGLLPRLKPAFLGVGTFGGRWATRSD
jgi:hypothetical protein